MNAPVPTQIAEAVGHAFLPPSGAATWVRCALAPTMWAMFPERGADKTAADEGTAAHWVFGEMFAARGVEAGQVAPNGVVVVDEMLDGAEMFVAAVMEAWTACAPIMPAGIRPTLHIERPVRMPSIHALNWGTPDVWFYDPLTRTIYLFDYKFGFGYVDEFENWQLIDYTAGILDELGLDDLATNVVMTIVQPRCYHRDGPVRTWRVQAANLRAQFNILRGAAERVVQVNPPATTNDGCTHCSGRFACPAIQRQGYEAAEISSHSLPDEMTPAARALELRYLRRMLSRLEARVSGLEDSVHDDLARGEPVPFFALERSAGKLAWTVQAPEVATLGRMLNVDLTKPGVLTPTQARDKLKKSGLDPAIIAAYATNPPGAMKLVPFDSKTARKAFQK